MALRRLTIGDCRHPCSLFPGSSPVGTSVIPSAARNLALGLGGRERSGRDSSLHSIESHVIPAKAGIHFAEVDPRFRGGDDSYDFHLCAWTAGPRALGRTRLEARPVIISGYACLRLWHSGGGMARVDDSIYPYLNQTKDRSPSKAGSPRPMGHVVHYYRVRSGVAGQLLDAIAGTLADCNRCSPLPSRERPLLDQYARAGTALAT